MENFRIGISDEISVKKGEKGFAKCTKLITSFWLQSKGAAGEREETMTGNVSIKRGNSQLFPGKGEVGKSLGTVF